MKMKRLKRFDEINEKISWHSLLTLLFGTTSLFLAGIYTAKEYQELKNIYAVVNSEKSSPNREEDRIIEQIRANILRNIKKSNLFNKFDKEFIIDSIATVKFKIVDTIPGENTSSVLGAYIHLKAGKNKLGMFLDAPAEDNIIIITRDAIRSSGISRTITHEIYHYFDKLLADDNSEYSSKQKISRFIDTKILDEEYAFNKASFVIGVKVHSDLASVIKQLVKSLVTDRRYYQSNSELFARFKAFKHDLLESGLIEDINQKISKEFFEQFKGDNEVLRSVVLDNIQFLMFVDLDKLEELDSLF
jgi:hypothetical protein